MNISRKEFFKKSLFSLGDVVRAVTGAETTPADAQPEIRDAGEFVPNERPDLVAVADNERCLARNCGCFACMERCDAQAIQMLFGTGIRIDEARCTGCGSCEYVCPVTPKAVTIVPRS